MKLDQNLNTIWEKSSYGPGGERLTGSHLLIDSNGNLIVSGQASISSRNYG